MTRIAMILIATTGCAAAPGPSAEVALSPAPVVQSAADTAFLEVSGTGQVSVEPGMATVSFAVESEGKSAQEAVRMNADAMTSAMDALRDAVDGVRIETHGYTVQPRYARPGSAGGAARIDGYTAVNNIRVTTDRIEEIGRLIDAATGAGANRVASLQFLPVDVEAARVEALRRAVEQARLEARTMADALGVTLGPPLEVRGGASTPGPVMAQRMLMEADTPIEAAAQTIRATVTIRYRLRGM